MRLDIQITQEQAGEDEMRMRLIYAAVLLAVIFMGCADAITEVWVNCEGISRDYKVCSDCTLHGAPEWRDGSCYFKVELSSGMIAQHSCSGDCTPVER